MCQLLATTARHLLPFRFAAVHSVGVKFYPYTVGVKAAEIDLNFETMPSFVTHDLHFAKAQRGPFLFQSVLPINHFRAHCTLINSALSVSRRGRDVMSFGVLAYRAVSRNLRC